MFLQSSEVFGVWILAGISPLFSLGLVCTPHQPCCFSDHICHFLGSRIAAALEQPLLWGWTKWVKLKLSSLTYGELVIGEGISVWLVPGQKMLPLGCMQPSLWPYP